MNPHPTLPVCFLLFCLLSVGGLAAAPGDGPDRIDTVLPSDTLFYAGIDDYTLMQEYAASMPVSKILAEEEMQQFLEKPKAYLDKSFAELKELIGAQNESLAKDFETMMHLDLSRFFFALTHIRLPGGAQQGPPVPDVGIAVGMALKGDVNLLELLKGCITNLARDFQVPCTFEDGQLDETKFVKLSMQGAPIAVYFFYLGDMLVITLSETTMKTMSDLHLGKREDSLAKQSQYGKLDGLFKTGRPGSMNFYLDMQGFYTTLASCIKMGLMMSGETEYLSKVDLIVERLGLNNAGCVYDRSLSKDGMAFNEAFITMKGEPKGLFSIFPSHPIPADLLKQVPKNVAQFSIFDFDLPALYDTVMDVIKIVDEEMYNQAQEGISGFLASISGTNGEKPIDLREDILGQLGSRCVFYSMGGGQAMGMMMPSMSFLLEIKDYDHFINTLIRIFDALSNMNPEMSSKVNHSTITYKEQTIHSFQFTQMPMMSPTFCKVGEFIAFALQVDDVKKIINSRLEPGESILDNEDFAGLFARLPRDASLLSVSYAKTRENFAASYNQLAMSVPLLTMALPPEIDLPFDLQLLPTADCIEKHLFSSLSASYRVNENCIKNVAYGPFGGESMVYLGPVAAMGAFMAKDFMAHQKKSGHDEEVIIKTDYDNESEVDQEAFYEAQVRADLAALSNGCFVYKIEYNKYPASLDDLLTPAEDWPNGFYNAEKLPEDPWGNGYFYKLLEDGDHQYMIWSAGPNGVNEGGQNDDIVKMK